MAELVYQTWERITGRPWSDARAGGFTTGSYADNIALQRKLLGGWNPYSQAPPTKAPTKAPAKKAPSAVGPIPVQPGLTAEQFADQLALGEATLAEQIRAAMAAEATSRRLEESQLAANPADFVAYELYKRSLEEQGHTPASEPRSDVDIQDLFSLALGLEGIAAPRGAAPPISGPDVLGQGQFGVGIPTTGSISRSQLRGFSASDIGILSSFLRGGVEVGDDEFQGINPEDYFKELSEGLVPVLPSQRTQFRF